MPQSHEPGAASNRRNVQDTGPCSDEGLPAYPEGAYGWVVVACVLSINAVTWGINTTYGVYTSFYVTHSYFDGGTTLRYAFVGGLCVGIGLLCGPLSNRLSQDYNFRVPLALGALAISLGQCMAGIARNFASFLVCQGFLFGIGLGLTLVPSQPLISHWFSRRLSLAQGIANAGSGLGGLVFSNTTRLAIESLDVEFALIINGCISAAVLVPAIALLKERRPELKTKNEPLRLSFLSHPGFLWVWTWGALSMMGYFVAIYNLASFATDGLGLTQTQGAGLQSILAAGQMVGRPLCGRLLDVGGRINMTIILSVISGISCLAMWIPARSFGVLVAFASLQGMVGGIVWSAAAPVATSVVGVQDLGSAYSIFLIAVALPALFAQPIAVTLLQYSRESLGHTGPEAYIISIGFCGGLFILGAIMLFGTKIWLQGNLNLWYRV